MSLYLALDGIDGCGKSAQARLLCDWFQAQGAEVVHLREPGSTPLGEALRALLLDARTGALAPLTEALLFTAARAELLRQQVAPALARGAVVVVERCWLATLVYQGYAPLDPAQRVPLTFLRELQQRVHGDLWPQRVFVLDVDPAKARGRTGRRAGGEDRIEARGAAHAARVREGYLQLAQQEPRAQIVDAAPPLERVHEVLRSAVQQLLGAGR